VLRGTWCDTVLNAHVPIEDKSDGFKGSIYEKLQQLFYHFPQYRIKILLGDFTAKPRREVIFKPTIRNESLHADSNDDGIRVENLATPKI
jgi:hypothetical protein